MNCHLLFWGGKGVGGVKQKVTAFIFSLSFSLFFFFSSNINNTAECCKALAV